MAGLLGPSEGFVLWVLSIDDARVSWGVMAFGGGLRVLGLCWAGRRDGCLLPALLLFDLASADVWAKVLGCFGIPSDSRRSHLASLNLVFS